MDKVKSDDTLMLALRDEYINIYYRGGSLVKLKKTERIGVYTAWFDPKYNIARRELPHPGKVAGPNDVTQWPRCIPRAQECHGLPFFGQMEAGA